ncbi:hypothetical protein [Elizabethkingia anophelis]|uniref:hypothetical protein n=1 Tax=Elizabethkingia anophelis TaxID=1117645 RepID=UPI00389266F5
MEAKELRLSLKKKWFEMTKAGIKKEDYRDINEYWISRFVYAGSYLEKGLNHTVLINGRWYKPKPFTINTMTLGYPKSGDKERILKLEHKCIEIRTGNPEWGAEPGKLYFVIKHGKILEE